MAVNCWWFKVVTFLRRTPRARWNRALVLLASHFLLSTARNAAAQQVTLESPIGFFTNVASRLLRSELGVDLNRIQIYPTMLNTNDPHYLLSLNQPTPDAWRGVLDGLTVLTNTGKSNLVQPNPTCYPPLDGETTAQPNHPRALFAPGYFHRRCLLACYPFWIHQL